LLSITSPSGQWMHFEPDAKHRVHRISDSAGRSVTYDYDSAVRLAHVVDSQGLTESYGYDDKSQMLTVSRRDGSPTITNEYDISGHIISQTLAGGEKFLYHYTADPQSRGNATVPDLITDPRGLLTHIHYNSAGYMQSLPELPPH